MNEPRFLLVHPEIDAMLDGYLHFGQFPAVEAEKVVGIFSAGQLVSITQRMPKKKERPDLERVVGHDEVWAICIRRPPPGWRLLGRWYQKNVFVALRAWDKHRLATQYSAASQQVIDDWQEEFGNQPPHRSGAISDYIGGVINELA